jgi:hypothetical protein
MNAEGLTIAAVPAASIKLCVIVCATDIRKPGWQVLAEVKLYSCAAPGNAQIIVVAIELPHQHSFAVE